MFVCWMFWILLFVFCLIFNFGFVFYFVNFCGKLVLTLILFCDCLLRFFFLQLF